jgi:hypothetical protein
MPIGTVEYKLASRITETIDDLAHALTGDREYFWIKSGPSRQD